MNPIPMLRELLAANPFKPFVVCLSDGRKLPVPHQGFLTVSPHGIIWEGETEEDFAMAMPFHVTGIEPLRRRRRAA